jgi:hypothetical protein
MIWHSDQWRWAQRGLHVEVTYLLEHLAGDQKGALYIYHYPDKGYYVAVDESDSGACKDKVLAGPIESLDAAKVTYLMLKGGNYAVD